MHDDVRTPRWSALTPGMPMRMHRLRFIDGDTGGDGTAGAGAGNGDAVAAAQAATDPATKAAADAAAATAAGTKSGEGLPDDPATLKAEIARLRRENGTDRTQAKTTAADEARAEMAQTIGKALGLVKGEAPATAEALAAEVATTKTELRGAVVELAVYKAAGGVGANPTALLDSRTFLVKVSDLDPSAKDFQSKVDAAIKAALSENPNLKAALVAGASSVDHAGGTGEGAMTPAKFATLSPAQKNELLGTNPALYRTLTGR